MFIIAFLIFNNIFSDFTFPRKFGPQYGDFEVVETEHFRIWYPNSGINQKLLKQYINKVVEVSENSYSLLSKDLHNNVFLKINITILDNSDIANGESWPLPQSNVFIYTTPPNTTAPIREYKNWIWELLTHELTHSISFSTTRGYSTFLRAIMGTLITVNGVWPLNLTEGLAVYEETHFSQMGRGRSDLYNSLMLGMLNKDSNLELGISPYYSEIWPWGNIPYLYGYTIFAEFAKNNPKLPGDFSKYSAGRLPQFIDGTFENVAKRNIVTIWHDAIKNIRKWKQDIYKTIESSTITPIKPILTSNNAEKTLVEFSPDGKQFLIYDRNTESRSMIKIYDTKSLKLVDEFRAMEPNFIDWQKEEILFNSLEFTPWANYFVLKSYNLSTQKITEYPYRHIVLASRIDKSHIAVVKRVLSKHILYIVNTTTDTMTKMYEPQNITGAIPLLKARSRQLYFVSKAQGINLLRYDVSQKQLQKLFSAKQEILDIEIKGEKVYLLERANILPNILLLEDGKIHRVSNVKLGIRDFAIHKNTALVAYYSKKGVELGKIHLQSPRKFTLKETKKQNPFPLKKYKLTHNSVKSQKKGTFIPTLISMLPKFWAPLVSMDSNNSLNLGAYTVGTDPTLRNQYQISIQKNVNSPYLEFYTSYTNRIFYPEFKVTYRYIRYNDSRNTNLYRFSTGLPYVFNTDIFHTDYVYTYLDAGLTYHKTGLDENLYYSSSLFISSTYASTGAYFGVEHGFNAYLEYNFSKDRYYIQDYANVYLPLFTHTTLHLAYQGFYSNSDSLQTAVGGVNYTTLLNTKASDISMPGYPVGYTFYRKANSLYLGMNIPLLNILFAPENLFPLFMKKLYMRVFYKTTLDYGSNLESYGTELHFKNDIFYLVPIDITVALYYAKSLDAYTFTLGFNVENLL